MRISWQLTLGTLALATALSLTGCGGSFQDEETARGLIEKEDAEIDIAAEIAAEKADAE